MSEMDDMASCLAGSCVVTANAVVKQFDIAVKEITEHMWENHREAFGAKSADDPEIELSVKYSLISYIAVRLIRNMVQNSGTLVLFNADRLCADICDLMLKELPTKQTVHVMN